MNYFMMPSLEHIALTRIAIFLWNKEDIRENIKTFYFYTRIESKRIAWEKIEDNVLQKTQNLLLPEVLKKKVVAFIKPIGLEILKWEEFHEEYLGDRFTEETINKICWTPHGRVDRKKTAELLVNDENIDIRGRYKMACTYSLEYDIQRLWIQMPDNYKKFFMNFPYFVRDRPENTELKNLIIAWTYHNARKYHELKDLMRWPTERPFYKYGFETAVKIGNESSTMYFFDKLSPGEKEELLVKSASCAANNCACCRYYSCFTGVLCFLLSQMSYEQQTEEVFKKCPCDVLICLLDWPWQDLFLEAAYLMVEFLSKRSYNFFFNKLVDKVNEGYKDYDYEMLFKKLWKQCPEDKKRYVIDQCAKGSLLISLLKIYDSENVEMILKEATILQKEKIITSSRGKKTCVVLIQENKWNILEFFLQECISSKEILVKFKKEFNTYINRNDFKEYFIPGDIWKKFFELLDSFPRESNAKISVVKKNFHPSMKHCHSDGKSILGLHPPSSRKLRARFFP